MTKLSKNAERIWDEITALHTGFTNDSTVSKFFMPEKLTSECRPVAATFAASLYTPHIEPKQVAKSASYYIFLLSTITGVQIFLKERSLLTNAKPFVIEKNKKKIEEAKEYALNIFSQKINLSDNVQQVMQEFLGNFLTVEQIEKLIIKNHAFKEDTYDQLLSTSIIWGYYFAKKMVS